jgi:hypothetical protein
MSAFCSFCRIIAGTGDFLRILGETFGVYIPYAIFAYQAWTYVLLLSIGALHNKRPLAKVTPASDPRSLKKSRSQKA